MENHFGLGICGHQLLNHTTREPLIASTLIHAEPWLTPASISPLFDDFSWVWQFRTVFFVGLSEQLVGRLKFFTFSIPMMTYRFDTNSWDFLVAEITRSAVLMVPWWTTRLAPVKTLELEAMQTAKQAVQDLGVPWE